MQVWLGCSPELLDSEAPSLRQKPAALLPEQSPMSPLSLCMPHFLSSALVPFHSGDSLLNSTPKLGKALFNFFFFFYSACFVSASQDLSSSPSLERADSFQSVSLLSVGQAAESDSVQRQRWTQRTSQRKEIPLQ